MPMEWDDRKSPDVSTIFKKSFHWLAAWYAAFDPNGTLRIVVVLFISKKTSEEESKLIGIVELT